MRQPERINRGGAIGIAIAVALLCSVAGTAQAQAPVIPTPRFQALLARVRGAWETFDS